MTENFEKKPIVLNMEVGKLEVRVKNNEGEELGFAKVNTVYTSNREKVCDITHFVLSSQDMVIARMMLAGILLIVENNAKKIYAAPHSADIQTEEKVLPVDVYKMYQKLGFDFCKRDADMTAENQRMYLEI